MSSAPSSTLPLDALRQVATAVAANGEPSEVFELVARATRELLDVDSAGVVRYEGPTHGRVMGQAGIAMPHRRFTLLGDNTAAVTARTGLPSYVTDLAALGGDVPQRLAAMGQRSAIAVPVLVEDRLWGALVAGDHRPGHIAEAAIPRLADFAGLIGLMLAEADARSCVRYDPAIVEELSAAERAARLERDRALSGLRALAAAVDARDPSTLRHSERVSSLAERIAVELGWEPSRLRRLRDAALLHDVGKLAIPDAVLFKPGRLDPDEYEQGSPACSSTRTPSRRSRRCLPSAPGIATRAAGARAAPEAWR